MRTETISCGFTAAYMWTTSGSGSVTSMKSCFYSDEKNQVCWSAGELIPLFFLRVYAKLKEPQLSQMNLHGRENYHVSQIVKPLL